MPFRGVVVALVCTAVAFVIRAALTPGLRADLPWVTFWFAVMLSAVIGGGRSSALTLILSSAAGWALIFRHPVANLEEEVARYLIFLVSGGVVAVVVSYLRGAVQPLRDSAEAQQRLAAERLFNERRLALAQDIAGLGVVDWDLATNDIFLSGQALRNYGLPIDAPQRRRSIIERIHPDDQERMMAEGQRLAREIGPFQLEARVLWDDGQVRTLAILGETLADAQGRPVRVMSVNRDVTDERHAEATLRESEERFRLISNSAPVLMWMTRIGGEREFVNEAYAAFAGLAFEEARTLDWRGRIHKDDLPHILKEQVAGEASRAPFSLEARYLRFDDQWRWLRSFSQPRWGPGGEFAGFIGVAFDVTEEKQARADLERINELLAERVNAALAEKEQAEAALAHAQKLEALGRLTGGVAHDFNNLLTVIVGALDMIARYPDDPEKRARFADAAMGAARRGERLTSQLLAFSRKQALRPELADVAEVLRTCEPLLRRAIGEAVDFSLSAGAVPALSRIDASQFEAAILNLVVNARDATPDGGTIGIACKVVDVAASDVPELEPGRYVAVEINDTGAGMTAEVLKQAFDPFFTTKPIGKGTGLGLSQVYGFARQSGGGVKVESAPGEGARITIYLPLSEDAVAPQPQPKPRAARRTSQLSVLLVEDDPDVAAIAETMLRDIGCKVRSAETADAAMKLLRGKSKFDLLFTDVVMPGGVNGVELARQAVAERGDLSVLLASGYAGDPVEETLSDAPWPLLHKPYSEADLARQIEALTATRREPVGSK